MSDSEGGSCFAIVVIIAIGLIMMMLNKCGDSSNSIDNVRGRRAEVVNNSLDASRLTLEGHQYGTMELT